MTRSGIALALFLATLGLTATPCAAEPDCCQCASAWTATADAIFLTRTPAGAQRLLTDPLSEDTLLNSSDLTFPAAAGPRLSLIRHDACGSGWELNYFGIGGWGTIADFPNSSLPSGVGSMAIDDVLSVPVDDVAFQYHSRLDSSELNLRRQSGDRLTWLAGFRWVELHETYEAAGTESVFSSPFTQTIRAHNHLYGAQAGADVCVWQGRRGLRIDALGKAGIFCNATDQNNEYADPEGSGVLRANTDTRHVAFLGELSIMGSYRLSRHLSIRGGYQLMWIDGVALAPNQIAATNFGSDTARVDTSGDLFYHGAAVGVQLDW